MESNDIKITKKMPIKHKDERNLSDLGGKKKKKTEKCSITEITILMVMEASSERWTEVTVVTLSLILSFPSLPPFVRVWMRFSL